MPTWRTELLGDVCKVQAVGDDGPLSFTEVLRRWRVDREFRAGFISLLRTAAFDTCFWETRPVCVATASMPFESVLLPAPELAGRKPDSHAFDEHFRSAADGECVVTFDNLGSDATLIVPVPRANPATCTDLCVFAREAPEWQQHALWEAVAEALSTRLARISHQGAGRSRRDLIPQRIF